MLLKTYQKVKKTIQKELHQMTFLGTSQEKGLRVFQEAFKGCPDKGM